MKTPLNIALIGYGKMGKMLEKTFQARNHTITSIIHPKSEIHPVITPESLQTADICIDFTNPYSAVANIEKAAASKKNIVVGTSGWYHQLSIVEKIVKKYDIGLLYSPIFSLGVYLHLQMVEKAAKLMNDHSEYDVAIIEEHHRQKLDSPSGTAKIIGETLLKNIDRKTTLLTECVNRQIKPEELNLVSIRCGTIPGTHSVVFNSPFDTITLTHTAHGREGFALGAVKAAEWLHGKKGLFTLEDMMR